MPHPKPQTILISAITGSGRRVPQLVNARYEHPTIVRPKGSALAGGASPAFTGGRLRALGYVAGGMGVEQGLVYAKLLEAGATPQYAMQVATHGGPRVAAIISRMTEGQIYQMLGVRGMSGSRLIHELNQPTGGILGDIVGGILEALGATIAVVGTAFGQPETIPLGALIAGEGASLQVQQSSARMPHARVPQSERAPRPNPWTSAIEAIPSAISKGVDIAREVGPLVVAAPDFLTGQSPAGQADSEQPFDYQPTPQEPYYPSPDTEVLPSLNAQPGENYYPPDALEWARQHGGADQYPQPSDYPSSDYGKPLEIQPGGQPEIPPSYPQPSDHQPQIPPIGHQPDNTPDIDHLLNQLDRSIEIEQQQDSQQSNSDVESKVENIARQVQHLQRLEQQPQSQRDIGQELQQKQTLRDKLTQLKKVAQEVRSKVTFCMRCASQQDALQFLNGEVGDCTVTSQSDGGQPELQLPSQESTQYYPPDPYSPTRGTALTGFGGEPVNVGEFHPPVPNDLTSWYNALGPTERAFYDAGVQAARLAESEGADNAAFQDGLEALQSTRGYNQDPETAQELFEQGYNEGYQP